MVVLESYLYQHDYQLEDISEKINDIDTQINTLSVVQYSEELLAIIAKKVKKDESIVLFELLELEEVDSVSVVSNDYGLMTAVENFDLYIY